MIENPPIAIAIRIGVDLHVYPYYNIEPINAKPKHVPNGQAMTTIANQNDLEAIGK